MTGSVLSVVAAPYAAWLVLNPTMNLMFADTADDADCLQFLYQVSPCDFFTLLLLALLCVDALLRLLIPKTSEGPCKILGLGL